MKLIVRPLVDALTALKTHVGLTASSLTTDNPMLKTAFRMASIKSFEFTYEISVKLILRALENHPGLQGVDELTFNGTMRLAAEHGLIASVADWQTFRHKRNKTSHTYNEATAAEVFDILPAFITAVDGLTVRLQDFADAS